MTDSTQAAESDPLEAAIAENPEAVAAFVRRLDLVNELLDVAALGTEALDDDMVRELSGTGATLAEAADELATPETVELAAAVGANGDDLADALATLATLQRTGALDDLVALVDVLSLGTEALDDDMVRELARTGSALGEVADVAAERDTSRGLVTLLEAVGEANDPDEPAEPVGLVGLVRATRDPEVRAGLGHLVALARALGRRSQRPD